MIRIVVLVLLAANLLYFGWANWVDHGDPALTAVKVDPVARKPPAPPAPPAPPPCGSIGPFSSELDALAAQRKLTEAGWGILRREHKEQQPDGYWVYVANDSPASQSRTLRRILAAGIRDAFAMPDDAEFRVSVGIFSEEDRAEDRAAKVQRLKLDAVVEERTTERSVIWFDVPGVARETLGDGRLGAAGLSVEHLQIEACPSAETPKPQTEEPAP
ncbi:MAG TPA: hypothetical protein VN755_03115 [Steroidobacteraceae bacterium]|nr:hypothetical protein [Steroidobacteraceae bacterium]